MYNSILQFIEKDTEKIGNLAMDFLLNGNMLRFEEGLLETLIEFGRKIYQETLESLEQTIRESAFRKEDYYVEHKEDTRNILTIFGNIEIKRAYYKTKKDGFRVYLLDQLVGMDSHDKVSQAVLARALKESVETSYQKGGEDACLTNDDVTKQTVKKLIHGLDIEMPEEIPAKKKKLKTLHIQADEDHVAMQFQYKKGDLKISENGRKINTLMPKLILLYEDIVEDGKPGCKRHRLTGKHYFGGLYEGSEANEDLWLEVQQYIYDHYDTDYLETVYIAGDGAPWIVAGCQVLEKSKFVLDKFHLGKYIQKATNHLEEYAKDAKELIYGAINDRNLGEVKRILRKCASKAEEAEKKGKIKEIEDCSKYISNNWLGIMVRIDDGGAVWGCSAEGQVSHVLSARESSRPMGWSKLGVHKMTQLRVFTRNGGNVINLMEYQYAKKRKEKQIEKQDEMIREVKRNHKASGEETMRKEIPGLEKQAMHWMRDLIYGKGLCV